MSAAAPIRHHRTREYAPWEIEVEEFLKRHGYSRRPNCFDLVERATTSAIVVKLTYHVYRHTAGSIPGKADRKEWFPLSERAAGRVANSSDNGAANALKEAVELGILEVRLVGRTNEYRPVLQNWLKLKPVPAKTQTHRPRTVPAVESEAGAEASVMEPAARRAALTVAPGEARKIEVPAALANQVLVVLPGDKQPRLLADTCPHGRECELAKKVATGTLRLSRDGPHPVIPIRGTVAASGSEFLAKPADSKAVTNQNTQVYLGGSSDFIQFQADVLAAVGQKIQAPPPEGLIEGIYSQLQRESVDPDRFRARLKARRAKVESWKMLDHLLNDVLSFARCERETAGAETAAIAAQKRATLRTHVARCIDAVRPISGLGPILSALHAILRTVDEGSPVDEVEAALRTQEDAMIERAKAMLDDDALAELESDVAAELRPHRNRFTKEQIDRLREQATTMRVMVLFNLPRLT